MARASAPRQHRSQRGAVRAFFATTSRRCPSTVRMEPMAASAASELWKSMNAMARLEGCVNAVFRVATGVLDTETACTRPNGEKSARTAASSESVGRPRTKTEAASMAAAPSQGGAHGRCCGGCCVTVGRGTESPASIRKSVPGSSAAAKVAAGEGEEGRQGAGRKRLVTSTGDS